MKRATLDFFDCNAWLGRPMNMPFGHHGETDFSAKGFLASMDRAGIRRALVWHTAQRDIFPVTGNTLLGKEIRGYEQRLVPCWTVLPPDCGELGDLDGFFRRAGRAGVRAFRAFPDINRYLLRYDVMGELLDRMVAARVPLVLAVPGHATWESVYDLLADVPDLTVIITNMGAWGCDRQFRPLVRRYPNVYIETSGYITDGGIEAFVGTYGAKRMVFGSNYPEAYHGATMLAIAHSSIRPSEKQAIAGGNLERLLGEVRL